MPRDNPARCKDLEAKFHEGHLSQNPGTTAKPNPEIHTNVTSGAGLLIRRTPNKRRR